MPAPSDPGTADWLAALRVGSGEEMAGAVTRSHLPDGRVLGWFGEPDVVIDAEPADAPVPRALAGRYGLDRFWQRWTAAECAAKLADVPMHLWLRRHGLPDPGRAGCTGERFGLVISVARRVTQHTD